MLQVHRHAPLAARRAILSCLALLLTPWATAMGAEEFEPAQLEFFEKKIRPVLVQHCYECHSPEAKSVKGGLLLHSREAIRKGGDSGPAIVLGNVEQSLLLEALRFESYEMPPQGRLADAVIRDFERWVEMGAPDPRDDSGGAAAPHEVDMEAGRQFWSFQRPTRHALPPVQRPAWPLKTMDHFILARMESAGLQPAAAADRRTLARRVTFDLTGLPPTPQQLDAFLNDDSADAYEQLVERLLASPHFGERWSRMWLDVARYAEDQAHIVGKNSSLFYPNAYLYRDWVIQALNDDLPFDEFVRLQLAADQLGEPGEAHLAALGFIGLGPKYYRRGNLAVMADEWEDRVDTVARGLLGITVACARCHDHKFDPVRTEDYYALAGVFASTEMFNRPLPGKKAEKNGQPKKPADAMHIIRDKNPQDLTVFIRGDVTNKGPVVPRRFLEVLSPEGTSAFQQGSGRLELAEAIVAADNPLTARVIVNRVWAQLFGRPLVATPSNFGTLGQPPTHPQLLDDLAVRLMESGWSLKWLQREIVLSAAYRQDSVGSDASRTQDPANQWLSRMNRKRLSVEGFRDALLAASGQLDSTIGGPSMDPQDPQSTRRTIYSRISRLDLNPMLALFDFPDPNAHAASRAETITPLQKLFVLNSPFMVAQAAAFNERLHRELPTDDVQSRIQRAYQLLYARPASAAELDAGQRFLRSAAESDHAAWSQYLQVLFAANETTYID